MKFQIFPIQSAADGVAFRIFFSRLEKGATSSAAGKWNEGGWYASFREDVFPVSLVGQRIDGVGVVVLCEGCGSEQDEQGEGCDDLFHGVVFFCVLLFYLICWRVWRLMIMPCGWRFLCGRAAQVVRGGRGFPPAGGGVPRGGR